MEPYRANNFIRASGFNTPYGKKEMLKTLLAVDLSLFLKGIHRLCQAD
jgi:hypothetical protein